MFQDHFIPYFWPKKSEVSEIHQPYEHNFHKTEIYDNFHDSIYLTKKNNYCCYLKQTEVGIEQADHISTENHLVMWLTG
jgi:hypothetical protein